MNTITNSNANENASTITNAGNAASEPTRIATVVDLEHARTKRVCKLSAARLAALGAGFDNDEDDDVLVERIAMGDEVALDALRERHVERVYTIAARMLGSEVDAERIADRVFGDVAVSWPPTRGTVSRWIARLTRTRCRRRRRRVYRGIVY